MQTIHSSPSVETPSRSTWWDWWFLWLSWGLLAILSWSVAWTLGSPIGVMADEMFLNPVPMMGGGVFARAMNRLLYGAAFGGVIGLATGLAQWYVLRAHVSRAVWWIPATLVGLAVGTGLGWLVRWGVVWSLFSHAGEAVFHTMHGSTGSMISTLVTGVTFGAVGGAVLGVCQWLVLRRSLPGARWWILATTIGMTAGMMPAWVVENQQIGELIWAVRGGVAAVFYSAITGIALVGLLRKQQLQG